MGDEEGVRVIEQPPRTVAAIGGRGAYSERNFRRAEAALRTWLAEQDAWEIDGEAHGVFWHGPFTPWFRKQYEVHIPVRPTTQSEAASVAEARVQTSARPPRRGRSSGVRNRLSVAGRG